MLDGAPNVVVFWFTCNRSPEEGVEVRRMGGGEVRGMGGGVRFVENVIIICTAIDSCVKLQYV